ncbi:hypothetical protein K4S75_11385 [Staphylococcus epidermidis]|uniref:Uncharacterized protein n=1 Tax=Staphylococcus warneri TaxID=1292 RepID=A0A8B2ZF58_STAWA|nr:hypothetical protein [Staphylococcus warneri]MCG1060649.1 hypothetical protein [Staphylococcus epidermidis]RGM28332.1 hypothetical protein DXC19_11655 [Staphylococcus warneri]
MTKNSLIIYKNRYLISHVENVANGYNVYIKLSKDSDEYSESDGYLFFKCRDNINEWQLKDIGIAVSCRGQNYGAAMLYKAIDIIQDLLSKNPESGDILLFGKIEQLYVKDIEGHGNKDAYQRIKCFYKGMRFEFKNDSDFKKRIENLEHLKEWQHTIKQYMIIQDLQFDLAMQEHILETYKNDIENMKKSFIGRLMMKVQRKRKGVHRG